MSSYSVTTHLTTHAHSFEYFCRVRTSTDRTRLTSAVVLTVSSLAYTTKTMAFYYTLETFTLRSTYNVNKSCVIEQFYGNSVTQIQLCFKFFELSQVFLGSYSSFLKVTHQRLCSVLLLLVLEAQLNSFITVLFYSFHLSNNTRTCFDNSAWYILTLGTENGCHSDFFS